MIRIVLFVSGLVLLLVVAASAYVRLSDLPTDEWHVDPLTAPAAGSDNAFRAVPEEDQTVDAQLRTGIYPASADAVAEALGEIALAEPGTRVLAATPGEAWVTYVQRSQVFGFPDLISVRVEESGEGGATVAIFSRARFGKSDMGVNERRVRRWLDGLERAVGRPE